MSERLDAVPGFESKSLRNIEGASEILPTEQDVFETFRQICGETSFTEANREEVGGTVTLIEAFMDKRDKEGRAVKLDYYKGSVNVAYFDPTKGYDYRPGRGYRPEDIVPGKALGSFKGGVLNW